MNNKRTNYLSGCSLMKGIESSCVKKITLLIVVFCIVAASSIAGEVSSKEIAHASPECRFRAREWQVDASVAGQICARGAGLGGDLGVSYFWSKYFGIGIDDSVMGHKPWNTVGAVGLDTFQGNLFFRYPIASWNMAPYLMVGGGGIWGVHSQGNGNLGGGLEYRFTPNIGCFMDCRWLYGTSDYCLTGSPGSLISMTLTRIGLRFAF